MFTLGLILYLLALCTEILGEGTCWYAHLQRIVPIAGCAGFALMMVSLGIAGWRVLP
jgi:hypothetical protein